MSTFRHTAIYNDYCRRIGINHVLPVPIIANPRLVMSLVLNRQGRDFNDQECALLSCLQPALANLYRVASFAEHDASVAVEVALTARERETLRWVATGKADAQIAVILDASTQTVQKHLLNPFVKLGVKNCTVTVMRMMEIDRHRG